LSEHHTTYETPHDINHNPLLLPGIYIACHSANGDSYSGKAAVSNARYERDVFADDECDVHRTDATGARHPTRRVQRQYYEALIKEGFTKEESLNIVKATQLPFAGTK